MFGTDVECTKYRFYGRRKPVLLQPKIHSMKCHPLLKQIHERCDGDPSICLWIYTVTFSAGFSGVRASFNNGITGILSQKKGQCLIALPFFFWHIYQYQCYILVWKSEGRSNPMLLLPTKEVVMKKSTTISLLIQQYSYQFFNKHRMWENYLYYE